MVFNGNLPLHWSKAHLTCPQNDQKVSPAQSHVWTSAREPLSHFLLSSFLLLPPPSLLSWCFKTVLIPILYLIPSCSVLVSSPLFPIKSVLLPPFQLMSTLYGLFQTSVCTLEFGLWKCKMIFRRNYVIILNIPTQRCIFIRIQKAKFFIYTGLIFGFDLWNEMQRP